MLRSSFLLAAAVVLTFLGGAIHGQLTRRWGASDICAELGSRLNHLPERIGHWHGMEPIAMSDNVKGLLQCTGYVTRPYIHDETGETVNLAVVVGPSGPISVHSPEICYSSREYVQQGERRQATIHDTKGEDNQLWSIVFESTDVQKTLLSVHYGWTTDGKWLKVEDPRFAFAGQSALLKLQLASTVTTDADGKRNNPSERFLADFLPVLREQVFGAGSHGP